jgi:hypothetical protein
MLFHEIAKSARDLGDAKDAGGVGHAGERELESGYENRNNLLVNRRTVKAARLKSTVSTQAENPSPRAGGTRTVLRLVGYRVHREPINYFK